MYVYTSTSESQLATVSLSDYVKSVAYGELFVRPAPARPFMPAAGNPEEAEFGGIKLALMSTRLSFFYTFIITNSSDI